MTYSDNFRTHCLDECFEHASNDDGTLNQDKFDKKMEEL